MKTERLILQKLGESDVPDLYALDRDVAVRRFIDDGLPPDPWPAYRARNEAKIAPDSASMAGLA